MERVVRVAEFVNEIDQVDQEWMEFYGGNYSVWSNGLFCCLLFLLFDDNVHKPSECDIMHYQYVLYGHRVTVQV